MNKKCSKCKLDKSINDFHKDKKSQDGYSYTCKECTKKRRKNHYKSNKEKTLSVNKKYREQNSTKVKAQKKDYYQNNKDQIIKKTGQYSKDNRETLNKKRREKRNKNKELFNTKERSYKSKNKKRINKKRNDRVNVRKQIDPIFKTALLVRRLINDSFRKKDLTKNKRTESILGLSFSEFKTYLESKFEPWMNWSNYGKYNGTLNFGWDVDHIIPLNTAKTEEDIIKLNHYTNLQPLCSKINRDIKRGDF